MDNKECIFCKKVIEHGTGKMFVKKDGGTIFFCSSKCQRNLQKLGRNPRKVKWISKSK